jgi:NADP-dependent 3-hydroxy acid dehydrogenase YdfG
MTFDYQGRVAVVTGASSGIGRAIALDLARRGATVVAAARRKELLDDVAEQCRRTAPSSEAQVLDVSDRTAVETMIAAVIERLGKVDILVNNAGIPMRKHARRLTVEDIERVMNVNFMGMVYATFAVLPSMLARRSGDVVNISSVAGRVTSPREGGYTASKFAMAGLTEVLASDLLGSGVRFHLVNPGPIKTEIWEKVDEPPAYKGRFYPPEDVAAAVRDCLERDRFERWVPRRMAAAGLFHALFPKQFIKGTARYDRRAGS